MTAPLTGAGMDRPEVNAAEQSRMELQAKLNGLGGLNGRQLSPEAKAKKLREACEGFESIFIQKMWQEMRNAVPKTGILSGREERFWQDMYDQELSKSMTKAGGIGLADMMYDQLSRNLVSASRSAAGSAAGAAFVPSAAPLLPEPEQMAEPLQAETATAIYDGEAPEMGSVAGETAQKPGQPALAENVKAQPAPVQAAQPAQPPLQPEPLQAAQPVQPVAEKKATVEAPKKHLHKADLNQASGLQMAQKARREAGDKLSAHAVRPSSQRRKEREAAKAAQMVEPVQSTPAPGSAEALRAAVEMARTGAAPEMMTTQPLNLGALAANAQAMNFAAQTPMQTAGPSQATEAAEPVTRTVRFTTNVPQNTDTRKKSKQAIRMLNVDNVGVNSKQGKGLAAYHAQQEAALAASSASAQTSVSPLTAGQAAPLTADNQAAAAPIPPLTPKSQATRTQAPASFAVPPLTATEARS